jgi:hypothetical protein
MDNDTNESVSIGDTTARKRKTIAKKNLFRSSGDAGRTPRERANGPVTHRYPTVPISNAMIIVGSKFHA